MTIYKVILVSFPFSEVGISKTRPALVLKTINQPSLGNLYLVAMITSQVDGVRFKHDLELNNWQEVGLPKPSLVRLAKLVTIHEDLVLKELGVVSTSDSKLIVRELKRFFN